jgi:methionyl-tRNA synthetase
LQERYYITTPIYYVNAPPHLGHAYTTIVADVLSRFHILRGDETFFLTGTDEHGDKIVAAAEKAGRATREYVDQVSGLFRALWPKLNIGNNDFIRTTDPHHQETVKTILNLVKDKGDIYFSDYTGLYCFGCERFYTERELVEGKCPDHQVEPTLISESNYFFRMSKYQDWLIGHIHAYPDFIRPERYRNEVLAFLREPLEDLCISRPKSRLSWGITLPFDENYVTYVWFDALINYVSALGYPDGGLFKTLWPVAQHLVAKDILKPHGIYWPCMLKAAGIEPYRHLNVHGYWNVNQGKMSKSLGNVVKPLDLVDIYGLDAFRYFLIREMVFGLDSEFSEEALVARINADLANDLGNLVSRSLTMVHNYFKGELPDPGVAEAIDDELKESALYLVEGYAASMEELGLHKALILTWEFIGKVNKYIVTTEPWVLAKADRSRLATVMFHIVESIKTVSVLIWPVMPETAEKIQDLLGLFRKGRDLKLDDVRQWGKEKPARAVAKAPHLFQRIEGKKQEDRGQRAEGRRQRTEDRGQRTEGRGQPFDKAQGKRSEVREEKSTETGSVPGKSNEKTKEPVKEMIGLKAFQALDIRIGTVKTAEAIPGSKKLLRLTVDIGEERTVVAGLAGLYAETDLVGKQVVLLANLEPATLMGVESRGMLLAAEDKSGVHILVPDAETAPGSKVR